MTPALRNYGISQQGEFESLRDVLWWLRHELMGHVSWRYWSYGISEGTIIYKSVATYEYVYVFFMFSGFSIATFYFYPHLIVSQF